MNDPHVVYLRYAVDAADAELDFRADPLELETDDYTVRLAADEEGVPGIVARTSARLADADPSVTEEVPPDTEAVVVMKSHYPNVEAARAAVEPYLRAWAVEAALAGGPRFDFVEVGDLVIDRNPPPGEDATYAVTGGGRFHVRNPARSTPIDAYPVPSGYFALDEHSETLWLRWEKYLEGSDNLTSAAYSILTYLEHRFASNRTDAATKLGVSAKILDTLGRLASAVGDATSARKFGRDAPTRRHTDEELEWIEATIPQLVRRAGLVAAEGDANSLPLLTVADLPTLRT
jgi:hypothetical protein